MVCLILLVNLRPFGERRVEKLTIDVYKRCHFLKRLEYFVTLKKLDHKYCHANCYLCAVMAIILSSLITCNTCNKCY